MSGVNTFSTTVRSLVVEWLSFDPELVKAVREAFPEWMAFVFAFVSYFGSVWFVAPAIVLAYWFGPRHRIAPWVATVMGG